MAAKRNLTSPSVIFGLLTLLISLGGAIALYIYTSWILLTCWLISINVTSFSVYSFDKIQAIRDGLRVPEKVLHAIIIVGGGIGGLVAMITFRHKIRKVKFQIIFWTILVLQTAGATTWFILK